MRKYFLFSFVFMISICYASDELSLNTAYEKYEQGLQSTHRIQRQQVFNDVLTTYQQLEKNNQPNRSGLLYLSIGDVYYQLEAYPWAILYYYRALKFDPHNPSIQDHLYRAQAQAGIPIGIEQSLLKKILTVNGHLSLFDSWELLFWIMLFSCVMIIITVWRQYRFKQQVIAILIGLNILLLLRIGLLLYLIPVQGVLVQSTGLYSQPSVDATQVSVNPLSSGELVSIIEQDPTGHWIKISNMDGAIGYIHQVAIRLIE